MHADENPDRRIGRVRAHNHLEVAGACPKHRILDAASAGNVS